MYNPPTRKTNLQKTKHKNQNLHLLVLNLIPNHQNLHYQIILNFNFILILTLLLRSILGVNIIITTIIIDYYSINRRGLMNQLCLQMGFVNCFPRLFVVNSFQ